MCRLCFSLNTLCVHVCVYVCVCVCVCVCDLSRCKKIRAIFIQLLTTLLFFVSFIYLFFFLKKKIEEKLGEHSPFVYFQAALLYTSSNGERRIRVHTLALPISTDLNVIFSQADQQAVIALVSKMGKRVRVRERERERERERKN